MTARRKAKVVAKPRYSIRQLNPVENAERIVEVMRPYFNPESLGPTAFIGVSWWGAFRQVDGKEDLVGVAGMCHSAIEDGTFYLNRSAVDEEHRGHGLQKKLILARIARARELKGVACTSDTYNTPYSANNLISCGFRAFNPASPWRGDDGVMYWRLRL